MGVARGESIEEREIKLRVSSAAEARRRLVAAGAQETGPRVREANSVHDDDERHLRRSGRLLRVRSHERLDGTGETPRSVLTFKGPARIEQGLRVREEVETEILDAGALRAILEKADLACRVRYEKRRTPLAWNGAVIAVDETPIGDFVEVEGTPADVARCQAALGLDEGARETSSYLALWREHRGEDAGDMLFDEAGPE